VDTEVRYPVGEQACGPKAAGRDRDIKDPDPGVGVRTGVAGKHRQRGQAGDRAVEPLPQPHDDVPHQIGLTIRAAFGIAGRSNHPQTDRHCAWRVIVMSERR
jgi:hypothetical protein